jgi:hypothetical protein
MNLFNLVVSQAVAQGVSEGTIILFLLLPLVASLVGVARHLVGFRGLGIFIPTALALAFHATGIGLGLLLFVLILMAATLARRLFRKLRVHYLPRMALLLWFVSLVILVVIFISPYFGMSQLTAISIFPVLILILLAEEFIEVQIGKSLREAMRLTMETVIIALVGFLVFRLKPLQELALRQPFWVILTPLVVNILVGRFTGLRLLEYRRFRRLLK